MWFLRDASGPTDRQTNRQTDRQTSLSQYLARLPGVTELSVTGAK